MTFWEFADKNSAGLAFFAIVVVLLTFFGYVIKNDR